MIDTKNILCPNCGKSFNEEHGFCPNCGQQNKEIRLGLKYLFNDFLAGSFNIDSKFLVTFRNLITKPSLLTKEFLAGRRTSYLTPIRIYLLISFIYFAMLSFTQDSVLVFNDNEELADVPVVFNNSAFDSLSNSNDSLSVTKNATRAIDDNIDSDTTIAGIEMNKLKSLNTKKGQKEFKEKFNEYASVSMFFIIPIAAILLFWFFGRGTYYFEHLIFLIHLQSVVFLILIFFGILSHFIPYSYIDLVSSILILTTVVLWIKSFYKFRWIKSVFASLLFIFSYIIVLFITFIGLAWLSLLIL